MSNEIKKISINKNYIDSVNINELNGLNFYRNEADANNNCNNVDINFNYLDKDNLYIDGRGRVYSGSKNVNNVVGWINKNDVYDILSKTGADIIGVELISPVEKVADNSFIQGVEVVASNGLEGVKIDEGNGIQGVKVVANNDIKGVTVVPSSLKGVTVVPSSLKGVTITDNDKEGSA